MARSRNYWLTAVITGGFVCASIALDDRQSPAGTPDSSAVLNHGVGSVDTATRVAQKKAAKKRPTPVKGFADLHTHQFGHLSVAGNWIWGKPDGPARTALAPCTWRVRHSLTALMGRKGHSQKLQGYPSFRDWPAWNDVNHQQVHVDWLRKAHKAGLSLMVMSAQNNEPFCRLVNLFVYHMNGNWTPAAKLRVGKLCDDMTSAKKQINAALAFERNHKSWYKIVRTPAEARRAINNGKLAVVLSIEVSNLFSEKNGRWRTQLNDAYNLGVRIIHPVHELNNRFGGAAIHDPTFRMFEKFKNHKKLGTKEYKWATGRWSIGLNGFKRFKSGKDKGLNKLGLTEKGKQLIHAMIGKGMLVDAAHSSTLAIRDILGIARQYKHYPVIASHVYFRELMPPYQTKWTKHWTADLMSGLKATGGMVGLRTGPKEVLGYMDAAVSNTCHGSSRSFAQSYAFARQALGVNVGFATDLNGMIEQIAPRFASKNDSCGYAYHHCVAGLVGKAKSLVGACGAYRHERNSQQMVQGNRTSKGTNTDFDKKGFAHIGHLGNLLKDLQVMGAKTNNLERSAENFIRMWERAHDKKRKPLDGTVKVDTNFTLENGKEMPASWYQRNRIKPYKSKKLRKAWAKAVRKSCRNDTNCPNGSFCHKRLGRNYCKRKLTNGSWCGRPKVCASNHCKLRCYSPNSKRMGEACNLNAECIASKCSAELFGVVKGKCVCDSDGDCSNGYCDKGFVFGVGTNKCKSKKRQGKGCTRGAQCASNCCKFNWGRTQCRPSSKCR